jgi:CYTH domain-containing protein
METVERKFLLPSVPEFLETGDERKIRQGYLIHDCHQELRVRQNGNNFTQTLKRFGDLSNDEVEISLREGQFEQLWESTLGNRIYKHRTKVDWSGRTLQIERYQRLLEGLITVEVRFDDRLEAATFLPPAFFGPEVTFDDRFTSSSLAQRPIVLHELPMHSGLVTARTVIGVMPFFESQGSIKVVAVTSRSKNRIIFPKGQPEPGLSAPEVALNEAMEEAGIEGNLVGHPLLTLLGDASGPNWLIYPMKVTRQKRRWQEMHQRQRFNLDIRDAMSRSDCALLHPALRYLCELGVPLSEGISDGQEAAPSVDES